MCGAFSSGRKPPRAEAQTRVEAKPPCATACGFHDNNEMCAPAAAFRVVGSCGWTRLALALEGPSAPWRRKQSGSAQLASAVNQRTAPASPRAGPGGGDQRYRRKPSRRRVPRREGGGEGRGGNNPPTVVTHGAASGGLTGRERTCAAAVRDSGFQASGGPLRSLSRLSRRAASGPVWRVV